MRGQVAHDRSDNDAGLPRLLLIMGMGRSGSTLLEVVLGNNPGMVNLGELTHVFQEGFVDNVVCPCGKPARDCAVWGRIMRECGWSPEDIGEIVEVTGRVERHARFALVACGLLRAGVLRRYRDAHRRLLASVRRVTGAGVVVDSSLYPGRAVALSRLWPGRVAVICLLRSPAGLMTSWSKQPRHPLVPRSSLHALFYHAYVLACMRAASRLVPGGALPVRLEDLLSDPGATLVRIERWCGCDLGPVRRSIREGRPLEVGHVLVGNRMRKAGEVRIDPRIARAHLTGRGARLAVWVMERIQYLLGFDESQAACKGRAGWA